MAVAHGRLVITGASGHRLHEQLIFAGLRLTGERPERLGVQDTEAALALALDTPVPAVLRDQLVPAASSGSADALRAALQARAGDRARQLTATLSARAQEEQEHVAATLSELAATIRSKLSDEHGDQLLLFTGLELDAGERQQAERDLRSLNARLDAIPEQIDRRAGGDRPPLCRAGPSPVPRRGHPARARGGADLMARTAARPRSPQSDRGPPRRVAVAGRDQRPVPDRAGAEAGASGRARGDDDHRPTCGSRTRSGRATRDCSGGGSAGCSTSCSDCATRSPRRPMPTRPTASPSTR